MEIKLGGKLGGIALINPDDYDLVSQYSWHQNKKGYANTSINNKTFGMHRLLMGSPKGLVIDHINHIKLDNRRENLRILTNERNSKHQKKKKGSITKYKGVTYDKKRNKYSVFIRHDDQRKYIGSFDTELEAAEYYDLFIIHHKMDEINLNFPEKRQEYLQKEYINKIQETKNKYYGVTKDRKDNDRFVAKIQHNKNNIHILSSKDQIECAKAYDNYVVKNNILSKKLNFPDEYPEYQNLRKIKTKCDYIDDKTVKMIINNKKNITAIIDKIDYDLIKYYKSGINDKGYVYLDINSKYVNLHKYLLGTTQDQIIDHIDSVKTNNTRKNLKITTIKGNNQNRSKTTSDTSSKYIGVSWNKTKKRWLAYIHNEKRFHLGTFSDEEYAGRKRDLYILEKFQNESFKLNFQWNDDDIKKWKQLLNISF